MHMSTAGHVYMAIEGARRARRPAHAPTPAARRARAPHARCAARRRPALDARIPHPVGGTPRARTLVRRRHHAQIPGAHPDRGIARRLRDISVAQPRAGPGGRSSRARHLAGGRRPATTAGRSTRRCARFRTGGRRHQESQVEVTRRHTQRARDRVRVRGQQFGVDSQTADSRLLGGFAERRVDHRLVGLGSQCPPSWIQRPTRGCNVSSTLRWSASRTSDDAVMCPGRVRACTRPVRSRGMRAWCAAATSASAESGLHAVSTSTADACRERDDIATAPRVRVRDRRGPAASGRRGDIPIATAPSG